MSAVYIMCTTLGSCTLKATDQHEAIKEAAAHPAFPFMLDLIEQRTRVVMKGPR